MHTHKTNLTGKYNKKNHKTDYKNNKGWPVVTGRHASKWTTTYMYTNSNTD